MKSINSQLLNLPKISFEVFKKDFIESQKFENKDLTDHTNLIGKGGFGTIFMNKLENNLVAIKFSNKNFSSKQKKIFFKEFEIQSHLSHENIVKTYGFTKYNENIGIVFEYCCNGSLREYLKTNSLPFDAKLNILLQVSKAIEYLHIENICHNDIKPHNILLNAELVPKLADFGLSRYFKSGKSKTSGFTLNYSSPEHLNKNYLTKKSDV